MDRALEVAKQRATQKRTKRRFTSSALRHMRKQPTRQTEQQQRDQLQNVKVLIAAFLAKMEQEEYPGVYLRSVQISPVIERVGRYLGR